MRRQSCFDSTDYGGSRSRASTRHRRGHRPGPENNDFRSTIAPGLGCNTAAVTTSLLTTTPCGLRRQTAIDECADEFNEKASNLDVDVDAAACHRADAPLIGPTGGDSPTNEETEVSVRRRTVSTLTTDEYDDNVAAERTRLWSALGSRDECELVDSGKGSTVVTSTHFKVVDDDTETLRSPSLVIEERR